MDIALDIATVISPRFSVTKLYGDFSTRTHVIDKLNAGVLVANYRGHGGKTDWSSANGLRTPDFVIALEMSPVPLYVLVGAALQ